MPTPHGGALLARSPSRRPLEGSPGAGQQIAQQRHPGLARQQVDQAKDTPLLGPVTRAAGEGAGYPQEVPQAARVRRAHQ